MASKLAAQAATTAQREGLFGGKGRKFYYEVCRCMPFIHKMMMLDELVSLRDMRAVVKEQFKKYKDVTDPRVIDMLIFKGREELEVYLTLHKQRHHAITEYLDPILQKSTRHTLPKPKQSAFLSDFYQAGYVQPQGK